VSVLIGSTCVGKIPFFVTVKRKKNYLAKKLMKIFYYGNIFLLNENTGRRVYCHDEQDMTERK
jgi:hypothetical protein